MSTLTYEDCPDVHAHRERANAFRSARFGTRRTIGRRESIDLMRHGWGIKAFATVADVERAFDLAVAEKAIKFSHTASFSVSYALPIGHSTSDGGNVGTRPISAPMFTMDSVFEAGEAILIRLACNKEG